MADRPRPYLAGTRRCDIMVDSDPSTGGGLKAPRGSIASMGYDGTQDEWIKVGAGDTEWILCSLFFVAPA